MISVLQVRELRDFVACLDLRFQTYCELGFIKRSDGSDLDRFDASSIHFMAVSQSRDIVGTIRLILPRIDEWATSPELSSSIRWCARLRQKAKIDIDPSKTIPIMETIQGSQHSDMIPNANRPAELSRIIVAPPFQGRGISRLLSAAVVEKAQMLGVDVLFLECLPSHVRLFQKLGFEFMFSSLQYPHLNVSDLVVAMKQTIA